MRFDILGNYCFEVFFEVIFGVFLSKASIKNFSGLAIVVDQDHIDTDQIAPARFLKVMDRDDLKEALFADWPKGNPGTLESIRNLQDEMGVRPSVLVCGRNFGCGSSREHAVWALQLAGIKAVVAPSFGDIFRSNAIKNQLVPVEVSESCWQELRSRIFLNVDIDLQSMTLSNGQIVYPFLIDPFAKYCLMQGIDELDYLLRQTSL